MVKLFKKCLYIIIIILLYIAINNFIISFYKVNHSSMFPYLKEGDLLMVEKISATFNKTPRKGSIIIFEAPNVDNGTSIIASYDSINVKQDYVKRIIAVEKENISIKNGKVFINNVQQEEPYLDSGTETLQKNDNINNFTIPEGYVFVMGDNRTNSIDSRNFGCIPVEKIIGTVVFRVLPLRVFGTT